MSTDTRVDTGRSLSAVFHASHTRSLGEAEMDCPNCGVYNPDERDICWRCDQEMPKPKEPKKKKNDPATAMRRMWIIVGVVLVVWVLITWLLPMLMGGGGAPVP